MRGQDGVVGLDDRSRYARGGVDGKFEFGLLAIIGGEPLQQQRAEARTGAATERVEDQEPLKGVARVCGQGYLELETLHTNPMTYQLNGALSP